MGRGAVRRQPHGRSSGALLLCCYLSSAQAAAPGVTTELDAVCLLQDDAAVAQPQLALHAGEPIEDSPRDVPRLSAAEVPHLASAEVPKVVPAQKAPRLLLRREFQNVPESAGSFMPAPVSAEVLEGTRESIHNKLVMAGVRMQDKCRQEQAALTATPDDKACSHTSKAAASGKCHAEDVKDCHKAGELLNVLVWATSVQQMASKLEHVPLEMVHALLGLRYWLYRPGPVWSFTTFDKDRSGFLSPTEIEPTFNEGVLKGTVDNGASLKVRLWKLMDTDGSGGISREELAAHLRSAVRVRELVPSIDEVSAITSTDDLLRDLRSIARPPNKLQRWVRIPRWLPLAVVALVVLASWLLHRWCCANRRFGERPRRPASMFRPMRWTEEGGKKGKK